ncbi:MAG: NAD(P)/FAD-dependent oxidoreductase [Ignisphaera sp.]|nr:NAD(P)/FAD-dependent oxidoreductase [Ignisphaera sp.]MCX8168379.1 NAD(P)/FAD-dependent oxidoreductase [Ignisphaera sp.]MDW8085789.1 FAD-dependent oxidoreductase [Ignisphaera sp.]
MIERKVSVMVVGAGPAGIAAATKAAQLGLETVLVENRDILGGIPLQCVHPGFGLHYFKEDMTGCEFIHRLIDRMHRAGVETIVNAYVHSIEFYSQLEKNVNVVTQSGILRINTKTVIYTAGARERHLFELNVHGDRIDGIYTAGEAQTIMDLYGVLPGKDVVIIGSGDVGLIMARRFALEGANVKAVIEIMPYPGGLLRNIVQCLKDFNIPLYLGHAVTEIIGSKRVEAVKVAKVDEDQRPIRSTEFEITCDTVVIAAGLVPNIDLLEKIGVAVDPRTKGPIVNEYLETSIPGIFAAGNALVVNDLVDYAAEQGEIAADGAKIYIENCGIPTRNWTRIKPGRNLRFVVPHYVSRERDVVLYARVQKPERNVYLSIANFKAKMLSLRPAEMIRIKIPFNRILEDNHRVISVEVVPYE